MESNPPNQSFFNDASIQYYRSALETYQFHGSCCQSLPSLSSTTEDHGQSRDHHYDENKPQSHHHNQRDIATTRTWLIYVFNWLCVHCICQTTITT